MLDCISGGRLVAGFPVGTPMDTNFCYGPDPGPDPRQVRRGARADHAGVGPRRAVRVRRQVQPAPLRELLAEADPEAAPADLHPRRRLDRDVGLLPRPRLQLLVPVVRRLQGRQGAARRVLGAASPSAATGTSRPYRAAFAQIIGVADTDAEAEKLYAEHILYFFNRCLHVYPGFADPPGYRTINTIKAGELDQFRQESAWSCSRR